MKVAGYAKKFQIPNYYSQGSQSSQSVNIKIGFKFSNLQSDPGLGMFQATLPFLFIFIFIFILHSGVRVAVW